ncbi:hypothetical protein RYX36_032032 [Vicia faba]
MVLRVEEESCGREGRRWRSACVGGNRLTAVVGREWALNCAGFFYARFGHGEAKLWSCFDQGFDADLLQAADTVFSL